MTNKSPSCFFIRIFMAFFTMVLISGCPSKEQSSHVTDSSIRTLDRKPNLLFIFTDEQRAETFAAYGNEKIKAPNLDRLAGKSFVFQNAYVTQPICTPSRSSIMTGLYPHTSGLTTNNISLPVNIPCLPELLDDSDYKTAYLGKWHLGDEIFAQHGFETWISMDDGYTNYYTEGRDRNARSDYHHWLINKGYKPSEKDLKFSREFATSLPIEHCKPKFLEEKAIQFLEACQNEPFVLYINFLEPHMPFSGPLNDLHHPDSVDLPGNFDNVLDETAPLSYRLIREYCMEYYGKDESDFRLLISKYWGLVSQIDLSVGAILEKLDQLGIADSTIVVFTSDHGDMMGSHKMVRKSTMFEESIRVPFIMRVPFISNSQTFIERRVSQIDIVPTLLDLMGKRIPASLEGKSLKPILEGVSIPDDYIFIEWSPDNYHKENIYKGSSLATEDEIKKVLMTNTRTVISPDGLKLCLRDHDLSQLFNLKDDPLETTNLFNNPAYRETIVYLSKKIEEWQIKTNDPLRFKYDEIN